MAAFWRKYGTGTGADVTVPIVKRESVDFAVGADWTPAATDVKISIDGGAAANIGTLPTAVAMGNTAYWKFVLSNAELTGKTMIVTVADSATKVVEDQSFIVETYGHASAMYPTDYGAGILPVNVTQLLGTAWLTPATAGTPDVNMKFISEDSVAADNAESFFDGTGYAGTGNTIPIVTTLTNKTGFGLASTGLDSIAITAPAGPATTFREYVVMLYRRFFKRAVIDQTTIKTYADDGTTVITTQTRTETATSQSQGAAT